MVSRCTLETESQHKKWDYEDRTVAVVTNTYYGACEMEDSVTLNVSDRVFGQ